MYTCAITRFIYLSGKFEYFFDHSPTLLNKIDVNLIFAFSLNSPSKLFYSEYICVFACYLYISACKMPISVLHCTRLCQSVKAFVIEKKSNYDARLAMTNI